MKKIISRIFLSALVHQFVCAQQELSSDVPENFVQQYYDAYSGIPKAERSAPFYADSVIIDPTYDWTGKGKNDIFKNLDTNNANNDHRRRIDQQITRDNKLVTEGLLTAKYGGIPYEMRFVNIFILRMARS